MATYSASAFTLTVTERRVRYAAIVFSSATNNDSYRFRTAQLNPPPGRSPNRGSYPQPEPERLGQRWVREAWGLTPLAAWVGVCSVRLQPLVKQRDLMAIGHCANRGAGFHHLPKRA